MALYWDSILAHLFKDSIEESSTTPWTQGLENILNIFYYKRLLQLSSPFTLFHWHSIIGVANQYTDFNTYFKLETNFRDLYLRIFSCVMI